MKKYAIILAAGKGTRMKSKRDDISKVSFPILETPLVKCVLYSLEPLGLEEIVTVVGHGAKASEAIVKDHSKVVYQLEQKGTGHAIMMAAPVLEGKEGITLITCGDTPLLTSKTLQNLIDYHLNNGMDMSILTGILENPKGYGRIIEEDGQVKAIREQKDCSIEENAIKVINAGVYVFDNKKLFDCLPLLSTENAAHEYYLTDLVGIFNKKGYKVGQMPCEDFDETLGVNDRVQLARAGEILRDRINEGLMLSGVTIIDPKNTYIGPKVKIGADTVIYPGTHIYGDTVIGEGNTIGPDTYLSNLKIGDRNKVIYSHIVDSEIRNDAHVGPYFRARKGALIMDHAHIGNFNEVKNSTFGEASKCAHLSYIGDSNIGKDVNIGCGTIIANYDGVNKFHSEIKDHAFIGSGTLIISPVTVGESAMTAGGSTITNDVPGHAMAIARERQTNKEGFADTFKQKALDKKNKK